MFGRLSLRQLGNLTDRYEQRQQREGMLCGVIAAATANWGFCAPKESLEPADFVPGLKHSPGVEDVPDEQAAAQIDGFFSTLVRRRA